MFYFLIFLVKSWSRFWAKPSGKKCCFSVTEGRLWFEKTTHNMEFQTLYLYIHAFICLTSISSSTSCTSPGTSDRELKICAELSRAHNSCSCKGIFPCIQYFLVAQDGKNCRTKVGFPAWKVLCEAAQICFSFCLAWSVAVCPLHFVTLAQHCFQKLPAYLEQNALTFIFIMPSVIWKSTTEPS